MNALNQPDTTLQTMFCFFLATLVFLNVVMYKNTIGGWPQAGVGVSRQPPAPDNRAALQEHVLERVLDQSVNLWAV